MGHYFSSQHPCHQICTIFFLIKLYHIVSKLAKFFSPIPYTLRDTAIQNLGPICIFRKIRDIPRFCCFVQIVVVFEPLRHLPQKFTSNIIFDCRFQKCNQKCQFPNQKWLKLLSKFVHR